MSDQPSGTRARRLGGLMHQLRGVLGPSPEDLIGIDLPRHQLRALFVVARGGPITVGDLARATGASLASSSSLADRLVRAGHLERTPDATDRRRVLLSITPTGRALVDHLEARFHERFDRLVGAMSEDARASLEVGLEAMIRAADELGISGDPRTRTQQPGGHA